jgi:hypothetical protein
MQPIPENRTVVYLDHWSLRSMLEQPLVEYAFSSALTLSLAKPERLLQVSYAILEPGEIPKIHGVTR